MLIPWVEDQLPYSHKIASKIILVFKVLIRRFGRQIDFELKGSKH
jgi:hypothetical protein